MGVPGFSPSNGEKMAMDFHRDSVWLGGKPADGGISMQLLFLSFCLIDVSFFGRAVGITDVNKNLEQLLQCPAAGMVDHR